MSRAVATLAVVLACATAELAGPARSASRIGDPAASQWRRQALEHRIRGEKEQEIAALRAALQVLPGDGGARFALAVALCERGEAGEAAGGFESLLDQEGLRSPSLAHLAWIDRAAGRAPQEIDRLRRLASEERRDLLALPDLAAALRRSGGLEEALANERAPRGRPRDASWRALRAAFLLDALGRDAEARSRALDALALDPASPVIRRGVRWFSDGGRGLQGWARALDRAPVAASPGGSAEDAGVGRLLARHVVLGWQGRHAEAWAAIEKAAAAWPASADVRLLRAEWLAGVPGRRDDAIAEASRALAIEPGLAEAYEALGRLQLSAGRWREAESAAGAAIGQDPLDAPAYSLLGCARLAAGAPDTALVAFRSALFLDPHDAPGEARRGLYATLARLGRPQEGPVFLSSLLLSDAEALAREREFIRRVMASPETRIAMDGSMMASQARQGARGGGR